MLGELTDKEIEELLGSSAVGKIGCYDQQKVYVAPVTYCYDGEVSSGIQWKA